MKKTLIASAVAAATLSTGAMAAESKTEIYGDIEVAYANTSSDAFGSVVNGVNTYVDASNNEVADNGSTLGIKHSHEISEGVTGFAKMEFEFATADENAAGINGADEAYIGVKGDFGSVQYGNDDNVYEWVDMIDTSENVGLEGELANSHVDGNGAKASYESENIQYVSPEIAEGLVLGVTIPVESDNTYGGTLAAKYSMDNLEVALAYAMGREEATNFDAGDTIGLGVTFTMDELTLIAQYETRDDSKNNGVDANDSVDYWGINALYAMGQNQFALGYQMKSFDSAAMQTNGANTALALEDEATIALQALHNVSDSMYVYMEYAMTTDAGGEANIDSDVFAVGAAYSF